MGQFITSKVEFLGLQCCCRGETHTPEMVQSKDLNFTVIFQWMFKHLLTKSASFQDDKYFTPPPNGAVVLKDFHFDYSFVYIFFFKIRGYCISWADSGSLIWFEMRKSGEFITSGANGKTAQFFNKPWSGKLQGCSVLLLGLGELQWSVKRRFKCVHLVPVFVSKRCSLLSWGHGRIPGPSLAFKSKQRAWVVISDTESHTLKQNIWFSWNQLGMTWRQIRSCIITLSF